MGRKPHNLRREIMKKVDKLKALAKSLNCELEIWKDNQVWVWSPKGFVFNGNGCSVITSQHFDGISLAASCLDALDDLGDGVSKAPEAYEGWWVE
jgi:hypothetical protein